MEITIGIQNTARELTIETSLSAAEVRAAVADAVASGDGLVELADVKGKIVLVPVSALSFVEIGEESSRRVGFGA